MAHTGQIVLIVDDDECMRHATASVLRRGGYTPIVASGPREALEKSRDFKGDVHLLLTDVQMPAMDGLTLAQHVLGERPHMRVLLMSGTNVSSYLPLVKKPFHIDQLLGQVSTVLDGPPPVPADVSAKQDFSSASMRLTAELDDARRQFLASSQEFLAVTKDVPSGLPAADGIRWIEVSARARQRAYDKYRRAQKRLDDHFRAKDSRTESKCGE